MPFKYLQMCGTEVRMRTIQKVFCTISLVTATVMAAHAADVKTDYDHKVDFSRFHTYSWGKVSTADPLYVQRIKDEVNKDLQAKGWQESPSGGDVTIFAKGDVHNQQEMQTFYNGLGGGWGGRWGWGGWGWGGPGFGEATTTTVNQPVGNLVIDMFDGQTKAIIWRGMSQANLHKKPSKNTSELDKDIDKMFDHFPPKSK